MKPQKFTTEDTDKKDVRLKKLCGLDCFFSKKISFKKSNGTNSLRAQRGGGKRLSRIFSQCSL